MRKIYIEHNNVNTLEEFILDIFNYYSMYDLYKCAKTYNDPEFKDVECQPARRSFEDILDIVNTNFKETTEEELAKCLYELNLKNIIFSIYCNDIHKIVFYRYKSRVGESNYKLVGGNSICSIGLDNSGQGKYTLRQILDFAGFKDKYLINE